mgnify:CR=1 FL=1
MKNKTDIQNIIIDTDMGWDDVIAILLLMKNPNINIMGITVTGCGETHLDDGVYLAKSLLELGNIDAPVCAGASKPSSLNNQFPQEFRNMMDDCCGLRSSLPIPQKSTDERSAVKFICDIINEKENITILSLGGLTNLSPLLEIKPTPKLENIHNLVIMGGAVFVDGNVALLNNSEARWDQGSQYSTNNDAEWNVFLDAHAAKKIIQSSIPITLVPLDACNHVILDSSYENLVTSDDAIANILRRLVKEKVSGPTKEEIPLPIFDPLAALIATNSLDKIRVEKIRMDVTTLQTHQNNSCGKTSPSYDENLPEIDVITAVSADEFKQIFSQLANN